MLNISGRIFLLATVGRGLSDPMPLSAQDVAPPVLRRRSRHRLDRRAAPRTRLGGRGCRRRIHADGPGRRCAGHASHDGPCAGRLVRGVEVPLRAGAKIDGRIADTNLPVW